MVPGLAGGATSAVVASVAAGVTTVAPVRTSFWGTLDGSSAAAEHAATKSAVEIPMMQEEIIP
jgi:hypothetical protein